MVHVVPGFGFERCFRSSEFFTDQLRMVGPKIRGEKMEILSMVVEMVPLKGGIGSIFHPPGLARTIRVVYKWYILPIGGWTMPPTSHLLGEPETTIESLGHSRGCRFC